MLKIGTPGTLKSKFYRAHNFYDTSQSLSLALSLSLSKLRNSKPNFIALDLDHGNFKALDLSNHGNHIALHLS